MIHLPEKQSINVSVSFPRTSVPIYRIDNYNKLLTNLHKLEFGEWTVRANDVSKRTNRKYKNKLE